MDIYPNEQFILKVICTLPVSVIIPERMFSSFKRIQTHLRNNMSEVNI